MQFTVPDKPDQFTGPGALALLVLLVQIIGLSTTTYDLPLIEQGEIWRLITGNLAHLNWSHLGLNLLGVLFLWLLHGDDYKVIHYFTVAFVAGIAVTLGLLLLNPAVETYAGLSGVLHGLLAWGVILDFLARRKTAFILAGGLIAKLIYEAYQGPDSASQSLLNAPVIIEAHLYGTIGGLMAGLILTRHRLFPSASSD
ncbi:MAG: rhombosortase [Pseudomonadales bacterium]|nr:rhombosortase [Pseudomonadales bacterium]MBO6597998.1 rhombosortase [Pseudomonadales bacterium]MBO6824514.1 rhombosortase [Pseudomonadales bacterium]